MVTQILQETETAKYTLNTVYLYFSKYCNLKCRHCWIDPQFSTDKTPKSDELDVKILISALEECRQLGMTSIKVTGGEPLLREDIFELLDYCKSKNISLIFETNGTLIGEKEALAFKEVNIQQVAVSLDGPNARIHQLLRGIDGSFDKAIEGIKLLKRHNINVQVIISLWRKNRDYIKPTVDLSRSLGVNSVKINIISYIARADKMAESQEILSVKETIDFYKQLSEELKKQPPFNVCFDIPPAFHPLLKGRLSVLNTCGILGILGILSDGRISICGIGSSSDTLVLGRIGKHSIKDIWNNHPLLEEIRNNIPYKLKGVCGKCILRYYCLGKCRAEAFYNRGSLLEPLSFCQAAYEQGIFPASRLQMEAKLERYITRNRCVMFYKDNGCITTCLNEGNDYIKLKDFDLWLWNRLDNVGKISISEIESEAKKFGMLSEGFNLERKIDELVKKNILFYVEDNKPEYKKTGLDNQKLNKYINMRDAILREFDSAKNFAKGGDLNQFHRNSIEALDRHFETKEITVSHLFREANPALEGLSYGASLLEKIEKFRKIDKNSRILDVGAGLGFTSQEFLKALKQKYSGLVDSISYVLCDLTFKFLENQINLTSPYLTKFVQTNAEVLPFKDNSFDIIIANENIADFTSAKLNKKEALDFLEGKVNKDKIEDISTRKALEWIKACSIDITDALPEFIFNLGAFEFMKELNRVLKPGAIAFICEYGIWKGYPTAVSLPNHVEYSIQFTQLIKFIKFLGMDIEVFPLADFLGFNREKEVVDGCSLNFLCSVLKKQNIELPYIAYTRETLEARLPENLLCNFKNLKFKKIKEQTTYFDLNPFYVLLIRKKGEKYGAR